MRFLVEIVLPKPGTLIARQLDPGAFEPSAAALLGEHMILSVRRPPTQDRHDLFAFQLDLEPGQPSPKVGDVLEVGFIDSL